MSVTPTGPSAPVNNASDIDTKRAGLLARAKTEFRANGTFTFTVTALSWQYTNGAKADFEVWLRQERIPYSYKAQTDGGSWAEAPDEYTYTRQNN